MLNHGHADEPHDRTDASNVSENDDVNVVA